jgi:hypothetical protein
VSGRNHSKDARRAASLWLCAYGAPGLCAAAEGEGTRLRAHTCAPLDAAQPARPSHPFSIRPGSGRDECGRVWTCGRADVWTCGRGRVDAAEGGAAGVPSSGSCTSSHHPGLPRPPWPLGAHAHGLSHPRLANPCYLFLAHSRPRSLSEFFPFILITHECPISPRPRPPPGCTSIRRPTLPAPSCRVAGRLELARR